MKTALDYILNSMGGGKTNPIYNRIISEMMTEVKQVPPELVEFYLARIGEMFCWAATGDGDFPMPPEFQDLI